MMSNELAEDKFNVKDFILPKYNEAKPLATNIEVIFENETLVSKADEHGQNKCNGLTFPFARSKTKRIPIVHSQILSKAADEKDSKSITEITLDIQGICLGVDWQPGDTIGILPRNCSRTVAKLLRRLGLEEKADTKCHLKISPLCTKKTIKIPAHIPMLSTPREILQDCLNLKSVLKKQFLCSLSQYCTDPDEIAFLKCLSSKEANSFYNQLVMDKGLTLMDVLKICPSCVPPLNLIIEHFSRLLPRPYSIANSPLENCNEVNIIYSTLKSKPGLTTSMLNEQIKEQNPAVVVYMREPNLFRFTEEDVVKNQILIAIGTGLSPFLGFLQHKQHIVKQTTNMIPGKTWLFVGATTQEAIIYRDKLVEWQANQVLERFEEAISRNEISIQSQYVQVKLEKCSHDLVNLLMQKETILYLCADGGQISKCIEKCIAQLLAKELSLDIEETLQMLKKFKTIGKFREDLWL